MRVAAVVVAGIVFAMIALLHLARLLCPFEVVIGSYHLPMWMSIIGFLFAGMLSACLFRPDRV